MRRVRAAEGVTLDVGAMEALSRVSNGDLRKAITTLQSAVRLMGPQVRAVLEAPLEVRAAARGMRRAVPIWGVRLRPKHKIHS